MGSKEETRIFVGGLSWETTERQLEDAFSRFGKIVEAQMDIMRNHRAMEDAITDMHGRELDGRVISVNKAQPKMASDGPAYGGYGGGGGYSSGGRGGYGGGGADRPPPGGRPDECFKCGRSGHWARECPSAGGGSGGGRFSSHSRFGGASAGGGGGRGDRFGGSDRYGDSRYSDRYVEDRYDGGRYGDRDRVDSRDSSRYSGGRDRYASDRYPPATDRFTGDRYGSADRYPQNGYGKERGYEKEAAPRGGGSERYGSGGPTRYEGGGSFRERSGPYDRPSRGGRQASYDDRY